MDCNECECKYGGEVTCERKECNKACRDQDGYTHQVGDRFFSGQNKTLCMVELDTLNEEVQMSNFLIKLF